MINILNYAELFKNCSRVEYTAYACKVPAGSLVLNSITDAKLVYLLEGKLFLSNMEFQELSKTNPNLNSYRGRLTKASDFVVNTNGVLEVISFDYLTQNYMFPDKSPITVSRLLPKSYICEEQNGVVTPVDITLNQAYKDRMSNPEANLVIPYFKVLWKGNFEEEYLVIDHKKMPEFDMYLPDKTKNYYVIVANSDETTAKLITEDEFYYKYNLRGKDANYKCEFMGVPESLFEFQESLHGIKTFAITMDNIIKSWYIESFLLHSGVATDFQTEVLSKDCLALNFQLTFAGFFYLVYRKNKEFYMAYGNKDVFEEEFSGNLEAYLKHLESTKGIMFKDSNFKRFKQIIQGFLTLDNAGLISNYYSPMLTSNEMVVLKRYTGNDYKEINQYLSGVDVEDKFYLYTRALFLQDIIERCNIRKNQFHFRGLTLDKDLVKEGSVINHSNFCSTSIICATTYDFSAYAEDGKIGVILVFKNTHNKHGMYADNLSFHRGREYEILFGVGSSFRLIKKLGYYHEVDEKPCEFWLCELEEDEECSIRKYAYQKDGVEKLLFMLQSSDLMNVFYISDVFDDASARIILRHYGSDDFGIIIWLLDNSQFRIEFYGSIEEECTFSIKEKGYNYLFEYIYSVLNYHGVVNYFNKSALEGYSEKLMFNLISLFTYNNFVICSQKINMNVYQDPFRLTTHNNNIETALSEFEILDENAKPLNIKVVVKTDNKEIFIGLAVQKYGKKPIKKSFIIKPNRQDAAVEDLYTSIVNKFSLDPTRRLKHIFSIVSGYYQQYLNFSGNHGKYECSFDDKVFNIEVSGSSIKVTYNGSELEFSYYNNIYSVASRIQALI